MTTIYKNYYLNVDSGKIDITNVDFSVKVMMDFTPYVDYELSDLVDSVYNFDSLFLGDEMTKLSMSEIIEKIENKIKETEEIKCKYWYVVYDTNIGDLCFSEESNYIE